MKKIILNSAIFTIIFMLLNTTVSAQQARVGFGTGVSGYFGDLMYRAALFQQVSPSISADASIDLSDRIRARVQVSYLRVRADDKKSIYWPTRNRNLNFTSDVWEISTLAEVDIFNTENVYVTPYLFAGPGMFFFNPTTVDRNGNKVQLKQIGTQAQFGTFSLLQEGKGAGAKLGNAYETSEFCLVSGLGFRVNVSDRVSIGTEIAYRFTQTDNLDDVSAAKYPDKSTMNPYAYQLAFRGDEINPNATPGLQPRGNPNVKDSYYSVQVRVCYQLNFGRSIYKKWYN